MAAQFTAIQGRGWGSKVLPNPWRREGPGRVSKDPVCPAQAPIPSRSLASSRSFHSCPLGGTPHRPALSPRMGGCGWGCPFPTAAEDQGQGFQPSNLQKPSLFIFLSCRPHRFAEAEGECVLEGEEDPLSTDPPGGKSLHPLRLVSSEKRLNHKLYRIGNVQKCHGGCWLVSRLPLGAGAMPISPVQRSWGRRRGTGFSPGRGQACPPRRRVPSVRVRVQVPWPQRAPRLLGVSPSRLYVRPLKVFMQV